MRAASRMWTTLVDSLVYFPDRELYGDPADAGLAFTDLTIPTEDGERLHAWWIPTRAAPARGHVLFFHGNAGNVSHRLEHACAQRPASTSVLDYRGWAQLGAAERGGPASRRRGRTALVAGRQVDPARLVYMGSRWGSGGAASREDPARLRASVHVHGLRDVARNIPGRLSVLAGDAEPGADRVPARSSSARRRGRDRPVPGGPVRGGPRATPVAHRARAGTQPRADLGPSYGTEVAAGCGDRGPISGWQQPRGSPRSRPRDAVRSATPSSTAWPNRGPRTEPRRGPGTSRRCAATPPRPGSVDPAVALGNYSRAQRPVPVITSASTRSSPCTGGPRRPGGDVSGRPLTNAIVLGALAPPFCSPRGGLGPEGGGRAPPLLARARVPPLAASRSPLLCDGDARAGGGRARRERSGDAVRRRRLHPEPAAGPARRVRSPPARSRAHGRPDVARPCVGVGTRRRARARLAPVLPLRSSRRRTSPPTRRRERAMGIGRPSGLMLDPGWASCGTRPPSLFARSWSRGPVRAQREEGARGVLALMMLLCSAHGNWNHGTTAPAATSSGCFP